MSYLRTTTRLRFTLASLAVAIFLPAHAAQPNDDIIGRWKLTKYLDSSDITALDDKEAAALVGKIFIVEPGEVTLGKDVCKQPDFNRHYEDTVRYLREDAHAASGKLGLPEVVTVVDLSCTEALFKSYNRVVILWKGIFFDAVKLEAGMPAPRAKR